MFFPSPLSLFTRVPLTVRSFFVHFPVTFLILLFPFTLHAQPYQPFRQDAARFIRSGDYIRALDLLNKAIRQEPLNPDNFFLRGYTKYSLDDYLGAELDYSRSIELSPFSADVFTNRAIVRTQQQNYNGALDDFTRALELDGRNGEIWFHRARTNLLMKKNYSCIVDCNKALELNFRDESVYILKASAEAEIKRYNEAIENLSEAKKLNPANPLIYSQRGNVWMELDRVDSALADFTQAIRLDSTNTYALFNRSLAWLKIADQVSALKDLNRLITLSPYNSYAYYNRAIVLIGLKDLAGAIHDFEIVSKLDPKNIVSHFYRSKLRTELKDYKGALADLDKTIELLPEYTEAWYDRYELKLKMNDRKGALADYNEALELTRKNHLNPDSLKSDRIDYLKKLTKLSGDFEQMNAMSSKLQNQSVEIRMQPVFTILIWKADFGKIHLYDVYQKKHYPANIITLTNLNGVVEDSVLLKEIAVQTQIIDSSGPDKQALYRRAVTFGQMRNFEQAIKDIDKVLIADSEDVTALFCRAWFRYELIQKLILKSENDREVTISNKLVKTQSEQLPASIGHTYDQVIADYEKAVRSDPEFPCLWFNLGCVNARMGNYHESLDNFSRAVSLSDNFAEAWYNRGLVSILLNDIANGCKDMSKAGEMGIQDAYRVMKRYCFK